MKRRTSLLSVALLLLALSALAGDFLIVPGQRIGSVALGMTRPAVHRLLHAPRFTRRLRNDVVEESWVRPIPDPSDGNDPPWKYLFVNVYFHGERVVQVEVNSPRFRTPNGLSVNSPAKAFESRYRPYTSSNQKNGFPLLYFDPDPGGIPASKHFVVIEDAASNGIAWRYGAWGDMWPDPDPDSQEIVIVHAPGMNAIREPDAGLRFVVNSQDQETHLRRQKLSLLRKATDPRTDVNARDKDGQTLLMQAVSLDDAAVVRRLLARHADVNARDSLGDTVLSQALGLATDVVSLFLDAGANVNVRNNYGVTPLECAGTPEMMRLLIARGADPNAPGKGGETALLDFAEQGRAPLVQVLLEHGADVNAANTQGQTALMAASASGIGLPIAKILLAHGANVNAQDKQGRTALMDCVSSYPSAVGTDIAPFLVKHGADVSLRDRRGDTALTLAEEVDFDNARMVRFLKSRMTAGGQ